MFKILHCHWLNKEKYNFGKLTLQGFGPSYNLCKRIQIFGSSYNLPKLKDKTLIYLSKNPKLEGLVMEWEGVRHLFCPDRVWSSRI